MRRLASLLLAHIFPDMLVRRALPDGHLQPHLWKLFLDVALGMQGSKRKNVSIDAIEGCPQLHEKLAAELLPEAQKKLPSGTDVRVHFGDIGENAQKLELSETKKDGLTVITANYVWHRLPSEYKKDLVDSILRQSESVIFLVNDLAKNGSPINTRGFNLLMNGPLNTGNLETKEMLTTKGLTVVDINSESAPKTMPSNLVDKMEELGRNAIDAMSFVAYKGKLAEEVVGKWR